MHRTDLFIVSGVDLEYTKNTHFMVNDYVLEYFFKNSRNEK